MAGNKYIANNSGTLTEVVANQTSAGAGDAGKIPALDSTGRLDSSMMPIGIAADTAVITASEALSAGNWVNVWNNSGAFNVRKADATSAGKEANGFVLSAFSSSASATVYFAGTNTQVSGQTPGPVFLGTTAGSGAAAAPSGSGNVVQRIGAAVSATAVNFLFSEPIVLA
jgi:hypothetical protein